ncbi:universal stress protein [Robertkochia sediminum]|uniref:universal stress protein n=1 Tax=Robertkochia sediminum TaxID=2785326 RepID=UPI001931FC63|nr:universal stress protein [Robertkochia sediminum]MBL7471313.1 universal stress protein [Robertkochia sediminum]
MKNILVPIGINPNAVNTLQYAIDLADVFGSDIYLMQAYTLISRAGSFGNVEGKVAQSSMSSLKDLIKKVDTKGVQVRVATYKGTVEEGVNAIDKEYGIDLIVLEPKSTDIREEVFLGNTSGRIVKKSHIPALIVPEGNTFSPYESGLVAFKSGIVEDNSLLDTLALFKEKFKTKLSLLFVKTPMFTEPDGVIDPALDALGDDVQRTVNSTTFEGVLEHFQKNNPDLLVVFRRKRGFFKKLWEKDIILKQEFRCSIPLLVLSQKK